MNENNTIDKKAKILRERFRVANHLRNVSDDFGEPVFDNEWILKNIVGMTDEEIEQMKNSD